MVLMPVPAPVVVAAVGRSGSRTAIEYAVAEATRRGCRLHLVHAFGSGVEPHPDLLAASLGHASALAHGRLDITGQLVAADPLPAIAAIAQHAELVVVGRRRDTRPAHPSVARTVSGGLGGRVEAPVVTVPDDWSDEADVPTVLVGVDEPERSRDVLATALDAAQRRGARLVVLAAWWRPLGAERTPLTQVTDPARSARLRREVEAALEDLRPGADGVDVTVDIRRARPGEALIEASREASLLVLGRHATLVASGSHLGPVARAVVREAACPVLLAAPARHHWVSAAARVGADR
ncbi:universal stress protein [Nocardioides mangrovi]|uniref:Universal stress protein n=1 Tax=Nocardioides mangrovi TaxID=2874580 RepID=A0ABS7UIC1_9ACTN|nr:universal stress protein [Nocardioides mangrovi]MBZ5740632.1 universal stress protein [Nocardioides mangrovi]